MAISRFRAAPPARSRWVCASSWSTSSTAAPTIRTTGSRRCFERRVAAAVVFLRNGGTLSHSLAPLLRGEGGVRGSSDPRTLLLRWAACHAPHPALRADLSPQAGRGEERAR